MVQIISISDARAKLSTLVQQVAETKNPIVIVRDSMPSVILYPYQKDSENGTKIYLNKLLSVEGDWFSSADYKKIRSEVEDKLKKDKQ